MGAEYEDILTDRVQSAEQKAQRIDDAKNTQQRVNSATDNIQRLSGKLNKIEQLAEELGFYLGILEEVFNEQRSEELQDKIAAAERKADISDDDILGAVDDLSFSPLFQQLDAAVTGLEDAIQLTQDSINEKYIDSYTEELDSAEELNSIIGDDNVDFARHMSRMRKFLNTEIWNINRTVEEIAAKWERLRREWEQYQGKQSWEQFQSEHDLQESTVEDLKQFTSKDIVRLSDLSIQTLKETKQVPELESALEVKLKT